MGDDGVGIHIVRMLKDKMPTRADLEFKELSVGGLSLVEEMLGYERVFIVDSIVSNDREIGRIREFSPEQFKRTQHSSSPHITNFATALELYKKLEPSKIPEKIKIFTIDIDPDFTFRERLSPPIQEAAASLTELITKEIEQVLR